MVPLPIFTESSATYVGTASPTAAPAPGEAASDDTGGGDGGAGEDGDDDIGAATFKWSPSPKPTAAPHVLEQESYGITTKEISTIIGISAGVLFCIVGTVVVYTLKTEKKVIPLTIALTPAEQAAVDEAAKAEAQRIADAKEEESRERERAYEEYRAGGGSKKYGAKAGIIGEFEL